MHFGDLWLFVIAPSRNGPVAAEQLLGQHLSWLSAALAVGFEDKSSPSWSVSPFSLASATSIGSHAAGPAFSHGFEAQDISSSIGRHKAVVVLLHGRSPEMRGKFPSHFWIHHTSNQNGAVGICVGSYKLFEQIWGGKGLIWGFGGGLDHVEGSV